MILSALCVAVSSVQWDVFSKAQSLVLLFIIMYPEILMCHQFCYVFTQGGICLT